MTAPLSLMAVVERIRNDADGVDDAVGHGEVWQIEGGWQRDRFTYDVIQRGTTPRGVVRRTDVATCDCEEVATYLAHWRPDTARAVADLLEAVALGEDERTFTIAAHNLARAYINPNRGGRL